MKKTFRRVLSVVLALVMALSVMTVAFAAEETVAKIGDAEYTTLQAAVEAAVDGDVITVVADHTLENTTMGAATSGMYNLILVTDKAVTIDLNGKTITANVSLSSNMLAVFGTNNTGELTLKDSSEAKTGTVDVTMADGTKAYSMFTALKSSKMYIESGNYSIDKVEAGQSMMYVGADKQMVVSGGDFYLGNAHTKETANGQKQPWICNGSGQGINTIVLAGGTYNVDPTHYHGEVHFPTCVGVVEEDGKYAVKGLHTPDIERATCQAAQFCTVCLAEIDSIKECTFENYVSNGDATCYADGTKTAECIYACGATDTVVDEGSMTTHMDTDGNNRCDFCGAKFCNTCGKVHTSWMEWLFCLIIDFFRLATSFIKSL